MHEESAYAPSRYQEPTTPKQWWRWPLVPLAALVAAIAASVVFSLLSWLAMRFFGVVYEDGWLFRIMLPVIGSGWIGFAWCIASAYVAPSGKTLTSAVMAAAVTLLALLFASLVLFDSAAFTTHPAEMLLNCVATILGSIVATVYVARQERVER